MSYNISKTNGEALVTIADGTINQTATSLALPGKNVPGYGIIVDQNLVKLLENFASTTAPTIPLEGQLWWNPILKHLSVWQGSNWKVISSSQTGPSSPLQPIIGDFWWDTINLTLKIYTGSTWVPAIPTVAPGAAQTLFSGYTVVDTGSVVRNLGNLVINGKLAATISTEYNSPFNLATPLNGLSTINPGLNFVANVEATMISSPNVIIGASSGNLTITSNAATNYGFVANVGGNVALWIDSATGLATVKGVPTANLGIATKGYVDSTITAQATNPAGATYTAIATANTAMKGYVDSNITTSVTTANTAMKGYVDYNISYSVTAANTAMKLYVDAQISNVSANINGGSATFTSINNTPIGNATPSTGAFTTLLVGTSLTPTANLTVDLGSTSRWWNNIYGTAIHAKYADLAERFAADKPMLPGTVVELGGAAEITEVARDLSDEVFGVISTRAAYLMNSSAGADATHPPVAVQGRVPVRVIGQVYKGDRLVSAGNGLARAGARTELTAWNVIGRALENKLDHGIGTIEAVVKLNS